ncbi:MAG: hypothetical protein GY820_15920, partial [Gammaproteobacteria bacterium]|nr:hypothetical protein [Gammaproteobacteria bacterium]
MNKRVPQEVVDCSCCDNTEEHYSKKSAWQLTDYSHCNKPNMECYEIPPDFFNEHRQPSSELDASLINPDNNNRPNTSCYGVSHKVVPGETTAVAKPVDESVVSAISQLRKILNNTLVEIQSEVKQQMDTVRSELKEVTQVVAHYIAKRGQESERTKQKLLESDKTTHTQVGLMQCYSTMPLEVKGSDRTSDVLNESVEQLTSVPRNAEVHTVDSASSFDCDQVNTELELNKDQWQQQKSPWQKSQTHYMYNQLQRQRRKTMLVEVKRYKKRRGKVKFMYVVKPMYIATGVVQGGDHVVTSRESVPAQTESVPRNAGQLNKSYVALSVDRPLQLSYMVRLHRINRRRKGRIKTNSLQQQSNHQMTLRQTGDLNFDGNINLISTYVLDETKGEKGPDSSEPPSESESGSGNWESQADGGGVISEN